MRVSHTPRFEAKHHAHAHMAGHGLTAFSGSNAGGGFGSWLKKLSGFKPYAVTGIKALLDGQGTMKERLMQGAKAAAKHYQADH